MSKVLKGLEAIHIVEDFLDQPEKVRETALAQTYPPASANAYFTGRNSAQVMAIPGLDEAVARVVGSPVRPTPGSAHGRCRIALADSTGRGGVHVDPNHWSGVLFLSEPPQEGASGTDFFRHLPSGTVRAPVNRDELAKFDVANYGEMWSKVITPHTHDETKWARVRRVEAKFNRLVLFRPWLWHNAGPGFGDSLETGRLVYLLFYDEVSAPRR